MAVVILNVGAIGTVLGDGRSSEGRYLKYYDPDFLDGSGLVVWTDDIVEAIRFPTLTAAFETWRRPSATRPRREDGHLNRPLTAYSISFETVKESDYLSDHVPASSPEGPDA